MPRPDADPVLTRRQANNVRKTIAHQAGRYVQILGEHIEGTRELRPTQVQAAKVLLGKVLPDEQRIENVVDGKPELSPAELEQALRDYLLAHPAMVAKVISHRSEVPKLESAKDSYIREVE